jgi:hypothetical protein
MCHLSRVKRLRHTRKIAHLEGDGAICWFHQISTSQRRRRIRRSPPSSRRRTATLSRPDIPARAVLGGERRNGAENLFELGSDKWIGLSMDGVREMIGRPLLAVITDQKRPRGATHGAVYHVQGWRGRKSKDLEVPQPVPCSCVAIRLVV